MDNRPEFPDFRRSVMSRLWIIGNSGAARECFWLFKDMLAADAALERDCVFAGFLTWKGHMGDLKSMASWQKGEATTYPIARDDLFVIGIGEPHLRAEVYGAMKERGASFFTLSHPYADISPAAAIGEANIFQRGCCLFSEATLGNANYLNGSAVLSHDVVVGDANFFGPYALALGNCRVGSRNLLAVRTTLLPNCRIGDDNMIAPGAVVYKGCRDRIRMAGNPALKIGEAPTHG